MHEVFHSLEKGKQDKIINSAMKVFSQKPYSKASTDDIASMADISKGSLFYYFKNKKDLYCYLYKYSCKKIFNKIHEHEVLKEKDFFEQNKKAIVARICTMQEYPFIYDFAVRAYYETDKTVQQQIKNINDKIFAKITIHLNQNIDTSKFKNKEDIYKAIKMLLWLSEGYLKDKQVKENVDLSDIEKDFCEYIDILKRGFYK